MTERRYLILEAINSYYYSKEDLNVAVVFQHLAENYVNKVNMFALKYHFIFVLS